MAGFRKAKAEQAAIKMGLYGPPGAGKTFTALLIAEGLARLSGKRIADAYMLAWTLGLKTTYYLRSLAASSVESSTLDLKQQQVRSSVAHQFHQTTVAVTTTPVVAPAKQPVLAAVAETIEQITETIVPKLSQCKLDDPSCESCQ